MSTTRVSLITLLLAVLFSIDASAKRKDDRLVLDNGDQMTGEIRKLEQGELSFKADYMLSEIQLDWRHVRELQSQDEYQVILTNGRHLTGPIERRPDGSFTIHPGRSATAPLTIVWSEVLTWCPWKPVSGSS